MEVKYLFKLLNVDLQPYSIVTGLHYKEGRGIIKSYELTNRSNLPTGYKYFEKLGIEKEEYVEEELEAYEPKQNYVNLVRQIKYEEEY